MDGVSVPFLDIHIDRVPKVPKKGLPKYILVTSVTLREFISR